jgi:arylsulfotransferase ASST
MLGLGVVVLRRCLAPAATFAVILAGLCGSVGAAKAAPPPGQVSFSTPSLSPSFGPQIEDYVVRCQDAPVTVQAHAAGGWQVSIAGRPFRSGDFSETVPLGSGRAFIVRARKAAELFRYHVRCLPNSFPTYTFTRYGPVSPKYFAVTRNDQDYGMIFDNRGVPIWWVRAPTWNLRVLANGNVLWYDAPSRRFEIHRLDGRFVRALKPVGYDADGHDLQFLANGDHLVSAQVLQQHVDTSAYGGSSDATVKSADLQQVTPNGQLAWSWNTFDHISLAETGRWWDAAPTNQQPYDIVHWNSIQPTGDSVIASFRHLDAVYKIRKSTDEIVWKLGGTTTPESLTVLGDPRAYTFGAQHDARLLPDGTLTVFDNRTNLLQPPRAVRFRIDEQTGTATLLQSITDPAVSASQCCGSARRLGNGDWLINWAEAKDHPIGGYKPNGDRTFLLRFNPRSSYRAEPVQGGVLTTEDLRAAMQTMCSSGCD